MMYDVSFHRESDRASVKIQAGDQNDNSMRPCLLMKYICFSVTLWPQSIEVTRTLGLIPIPLNQLIITSIEQTHTTESIPKVVNTE